jgi:hypothetical protein
MTTLTASTIANREATSSDDRKLQMESRRSAFRALIIWNRPSTPARAPVAKIAPVMRPVVSSGVPHPLRRGLSPQ